MGDTPDRGTEHVDPTPPLPFLEEPEPKDPTPPAPVAADDAGDEGDEDWEPPTREQWQLDQDRIAAAEENAKDARELVEQSNSLMRDLVGQQRPGPAEPEPEDPGPMPDAALEKEQFASWLDKRDKFADAKLTRQLRIMQSDLQQNSRANDLFAEFVAQYPSMADKRGLVEHAGRCAGLRADDPKEKIFRKVMEQLEQWGVQIEASSDDDPPPPPRRRAGGGGRTAGLGGGSGARRRRTKEPAEEKPVDLVDQISQDQARMGVY